MKKFLAEQCLSVLALLCSSACMAATIQLVPTVGGTRECCSVSVDVNTVFTVTIHGDNFPQTGGAVLGLSFNSAVVSFVRAALPTIGPWRGTGGSFYVPHPSTGTPTTFDLLAPSTGTPPSGSFDALIFTFRAIAPGSANILIIDNQNTLAWWEAISPYNLIPVIYTQALVTVVPIPAVGWLLAPAFAVLGWARRRVSSN